MRTTKTALILIAAFAFTLTALAQSSTTTQAKPPLSSRAGSIFQAASPSVVLIETYDDKHEVNGAGSGFVVSADGRIVTNYHVIAHTRLATVLLENKDVYDTVEVLDIDKRKDIAIIKIKAVDLPALKLGKSSAVQIGDQIYSLSSPLGLLQNTLSEGIISGLREGDGYKFFQTTAPISHGSSGGPIFNSTGEVIGITTATISEGQNLNFAIPIDYVKGMLAYPSAPRPLSASYEPDPQPEQTKAADATPKPSAQNPGASTAVSKPSVDLPQAVKDVGMSIYLERQLDIWTTEDAHSLLGEPHGHRMGLGNPMGEIWAYEDPSNSVREIELAFSGKTKKLHDIYLYPWRGTWEEAKKIWGDNVRTKKLDNGNRFYMYKDRYINILTNAGGSIISIGIYSQT